MFRYKVNHSLRGASRRSLTWMTALVVGMMGTLSPLLGIAGGCMVKFQGGDSPSRDGSIQDGAPLWNDGAQRDGESASDGGVCGNGTAEGNEVCDGDDLRGLTCQSMGLGDGTLKCSRSCDALDASDCAGQPTCGDGELGPEEGCDDGNHDNTDGCPDDWVNGGTCQPARCGDSLVWSGHEDCDSGGVDTELCNSDCTKVACGDRYVNEPAGEACDSGGVDTASCDSDCTKVACGDNHLNTAAGEKCEVGDTDMLECSGGEMRERECLTNCVWGPWSPCHPQQ